MLLTRDPDTLLLKDADSDPTVAVRKNGSAVGDSVTVTKRSATVGIYDCSYNPAGEVEGDSFTLQESATVTGTVTGSETYDNSFSVRVVAVERGTDGANTTAPDNASAFAAAASAASADAKLTAGRLSRVDRLPDIVAGGSGGLAIVGSEMALPTATLTALFSDADVAALITSITGLFDNAGDLPIQTIAAQAAAATVNALVANGTFATLVADASAGKIAAQSSDGKLTAGRLGKLDSLTFTTPNVVDASGGGGGGGGGDWTNDEKAQIRYQLGIDGTATAPTAPVTDPVVITPSDTGKTTLYALCVDRRGAAKSGVVVHCWLAGTRPAGSGIIADNLAETFTSGVNGVVQIPDRMLGFSYAVSVNSAENPVIVRISPNAGGTTAIPDLIS